MNVEKMTVEELKAAAAKCEKLENEKRTGEKFQVVILTAGFIYVGWTKVTKSRVYMRDVKNVRYWAGNGLGPSALNGPPANSKIDKCGDLVIEKAVIHHRMSANAEKWA